MDQKVLAGMFAAAPCPFRMLFPLSKPFPRETAKALSGVAAIYPDTISSPSHVIA